MLGEHTHVGGSTIALVVDKHGKFSRYDGFNNILGERVVAVDVALHEVGQVELGRRLHLQADGIEIAVLIAVAIEPGERTAEGVCGERVWSSVLRRYEENGGYTRSVACQCPRTFQSSLEALDAFEVDLELMARCLLTKQIANHKVKVDFFKIDSRTVLHSQRAAESLTREDEPLFNLEFHACTDIRGGALSVFQPICVCALYEFLPVGYAHIDKGKLATVVTFFEFGKASEVDEVLICRQQAFLNETRVALTFHIFAYIKILIDC